MGWFGHGLYDGDDTQTQHIDFIKWAGVSKDDEEISKWLGIKKTKIPADRLRLLMTNATHILNHMPKVKPSWNEDNAIQWQMLLALYEDNDLIPPLSIIYVLGIKATKYLMEDHADDFDHPSQRRALLRNFIDRVKKRIFKPKSKPSSETSTMKIKKAFPLIASDYHAFDDYQYALKKAGVRVGFVEVGCSGEYCAVFYLHGCRKEAQPLINKLKKKYAY